MFVHVQCTHRCVRSSNFKSSQNALTVVQGVIFHIFSRALKQKKNEALRLKMTKIASRGGGGPALIKSSPTLLLDIFYQSNRVYCVISIMCCVNHVCRNTCSVLSFTTSNLKYQTNRDIILFFSPHQQSVLQGTTFRPGCPSHFPSLKMAGATRSKRRALQH